MLVKDSFSRFGTVEDHPEVLKIYCYDFTLIPRIFSRFIKRPIIVVQPRSAEDVAEIMRICERHEIPIVPRGAGTSAYGGAIPLKSCVVMDFKRMCNFEIRDGELVAQSGAVWIEMERELNRNGEALRVYPTSANVSTVGGWIAQGGYGIGSLRYGSIAENLKWLEIVDFEGIRIVKGEEMRYYVGTFGCLGIITRACIKTRKNEPINCKAVHCSFEEALSMLEGGYHASFKNSKYLSLEGFGAKDVLLICSEKGDGDETGKMMWERRLIPLRIASKGKRIFPEVVLPHENAVKFYEYAGRISEGLEVVFAKDCAIFIAALGNGYRNMLKALKIVKIAEKLGGRVYARGMLFSSGYGKDIADYKKRIDPKNLLNPGKMGWNAFSMSIGLLGKLIWTA